MARVEETLGLFGRRHGTATGGKVFCQICQTVYNEDQGEEGGCGESIVFAHFGELQVCQCCFEKVEAAVLESIDDIIPWFTRLLRSRQERLERHQVLLGTLTAFAETQSC